MLRQDPIATSYSRTVLSYNADATSWPSSEKATARTLPKWPLSVLQQDPIAASHSQMVPYNVNATSQPSGKKATALTSLKWPLSVLRQDPVAAFYSRTVLSPNANATS